MTLEETIALMKENGESPERIQEVIDAYNLKEKEKLEAGKTNGDVTGASATPTTAASNQGTNLSNNNQQENTGSVSEDGSSDVRGITFDSPIDLSDFTSVVDKDEDEVVNAFMNSNSYPGLNVEKRGILFGNAVDMVLPNGETVSVDLKAFTDKGKQEAVEQMNLVKSFYENKDNEELLDLGIFDALGRRSSSISSEVGRSLFDQSDLESINISLSSAGYEIQSSPTPTQSSPYQLLKNGEVISTGQAGDMQSYLWDNISEEDTDNIQAFNKTEANKLIADKNIEVQNRKDKLLDPDNIPNIEAEMFGNGEMGRNIEYNLKGNISDKGLSSVMAYLNNPIQETVQKEYKPGEVVEVKQNVDGWQRGRYDNLLAAVESGEVKLNEQDMLALREAYETNSMYQEKDINRYASDQANDYGSKWLEQKFKNSPYYTGIRSHLDDATNKYTLEEQIEPLVTEQKFLKDEYNKFEKQQSKVMKTTFDAMQKANVGWEFFGEGEDLYVVVDSDDEELKEQYQAKVNSILETNKTHWNEYKKGFNGSNAKVVSFLDKNSENNKIANSINKEFGTMSVLSEDITNGFENLFVAIPAAFGHKSSMQRLKDIERGAEGLETMLTYEEAIDLGAKGTFTARTGAQQSANIITAVASTAIGIPPGALATTFGLSSAGGKRMELSTLVDQKEFALVGLQELEANKDSMSDYDYSRRKASLEKTVAAGTMTRAQLEGSVFATGVIEGGITAIGMGTIPNAKKLLAGFSGSANAGIGTLITRSNMRAAGSFLYETGKQVGGELLEEESIFFSDQIVNSLIMQKDMDFSGWDDVAVSTIITTGGMNGSSSLYSTVTQQMATSEMRQEVKNILSEVSALETSLSKLKPGKTDDKYRAQLHQQFRDKMGELSIVQAGLEVDALVAGSDNVVDLIENSVNLSELHAKAMVEPGDSDKVIQHKVEGYMGREDIDGDDYKSRLNAANKAIEVIHNSTNAKLQGDPISLIESTFGKKGLKQYERLSSKEAFIDLSARDQLIAVNDAIKKNFRNSVVREAKSNPIVKNFVESKVYDGKTFEESGRKNRNKKLEDQWYEQVGFNYNIQKARARTLYDGGKESLKALQASGDIKDLNLVEAKTPEEFQDFLDTRDDLSPKQKKEFLEDFKDKSVKGLIIGSDYIVQNKKGVQDNLDEGDLLQGTVISHEVGHALDDVTMKKGEMADYSENLSKHILSDKVLAPLHELAIERLSSIGMWDGSKDFDKQSPMAKEEYVKSIQDLITADKNKYMPAARKAGSSGMNIVRGVLGSDFKFKTPKDSMSYLADFIDSFDEGKLSSKLKRKKKAFADSGQKAEAPKKRMSKLSPLEQINKLVPEGFDKPFKDLTRREQMNIIDPIFAATMDDGVISNYVKSRATSAEEYNKAVESVRDRLVNFDPNAKRKTGSKAPITFGEFIFANTRFGKLDAKKELFEESEVRSQQSSIDAPEAGQITDSSFDSDVSNFDEVDLTNQDAEEKSKLRRELDLEQQMIDKVIDAIVKTFGTNLPNIATKQFRQALTKAFKTELKKPMQDSMGKGKDYDVFLEKFMPVIFNALPVETLVQMERLVESDKLLQKFPKAQKIFTESYRETSVVKVDELIAQGRLPKDTNRTSGPQVHRKLEYPGTEKVLAFFRGKNMLEVLGYKLGGSTLGTRKDALAENTINEVTFDAVATVLKDAKNIQVSKSETLASKIEGLNIAGIENLENDLTIIAKQINRNPNVRFSRVGSKLTLGISNKNKPAFINNFDQVLKSIPSIVSPLDKKAVYNLLRETYSDEFTDAELKKAAENISKYADKVEVIRGKVENAGDLYINSEGFLKEFILQNVEKDVIEKSLIQLLNNMLPPDFKNATVLGTDLGRVIKNRERFISFVRYAKDELGWSDNKILRMAYTQYKGMMSGAAKAADGRFIKDQDGDIILDPKWEDSKEGALDGNKWKRYSEKDKKNGKIPRGSRVGDVKRTKTGSPITQDFRGQIFTSTQDFIDEISRVKGFEDIKGKSWNQIAKEKGFDTKTYSETSAAGIAHQDLTSSEYTEIGGRKGPRPWWAETKEEYEADFAIWERKKNTKKRAKEKRAYEERLAQAKEAREAVTELMTYYINSAKEGIIDYGDVVMLGKMLGSGMTSPMKRAANLAYIGIGVESIPTKQLGSKTEYEHIVPTNVKMLEMVNALINDGKLSDDFWDDYEVAIIPKIMDKGLIRNGLRDFKSPTQSPGSENWRRYYNKQMIGEPGIVALRSIKPEDKGKVIGEDFVKASELLQQQTINPKDVPVIGNALRRYSKGAKGMSTFDFDETLIIDGKNSILATDPESGNTIEISSGDWPLKGPELAAAGYQFDFSDFANVRGGKEGPLLQKMKNQIKKYGNKNVFVLTARQQASAEPIQQWLKTQGIDLPLRNITGLGKSEGSAKGDWMLQKFAEGYNDMYFVDDALPNVKAVKDVLDQLDIKSKVVQAKIRFSKDGGSNFNDMLERNTGVPKDKIFSDAQARLRGKKAGGFKFFVPPSAEDFKGLLYNFLGKGKQGDADMAFFKEHLLDPFAKGIRNLNNAKQKTSEDYKALKKAVPEVVKSLNDKVLDSDYNVGDAIRVYLWNTNSINIPGLSPQEISNLSEYVSSDPALVAFAESLGRISRSQDGYVKPDEHWVVGNIASDLHRQTNDINRAGLLADWKDNIDVIFSPENMNKIEAVYGTDFKDALENILFRMETGTNRAHGTDKVVGGFMDWINGSVGAVMFFNTRSAVLQTLSTVNFINWNDNNLFAASKAFANQPQYWKDFMTLFNSDMLKQRRAGMEIDVNLAELSNTVSKASGKDKAKAALRYLLQIGFTPTQIADSFAIAAGGSTFYRNRINKYVKEGLSQKEAEAKAFEDFQEIAEETQQSSRPDLISQQQAGTLGRLILAWQNTPMQYTRLTKKAISDLVNGRGDWKSHVSRILYYGAMQNVIFGSLQTGLAFLMFGGDEDEEKTKTKTTRVANGALDTLLRGTGVYGAMASTLKNTIMKYMDERDKPYGKRELSKVALEAVQLSPPIGSKLRKIMSSIYGYEYNKGVPEKMGVSVDNPILNVVGNLVEATTNVPLARVVKKAQNIEEAINGNHEMWKRVALILGWDKWSLDVKDADVEKAKTEVKQEKKEKKAEERKVKKEEAKKQAEEEKKAEEQKKKDEGFKQVRCSGIKSNGQRCSITIETKAKTAKCTYHKAYKPNEGSDNDGDGVKEYQCKATTGSGNRCKNRTENNNKKCYAHQ